MNPYTLGVLILLLLVACAEVSSLQRARSVRRYTKSAQEQRQQKKRA